MRKIIAGVLIFFLILCFIDFWFFNIPLVHTIAYHVTSLWMDLWQWIGQKIGGKISVIFSFLA